MRIDENWFKLYEQYGETFNRLLTIGNNENSYVNYTIHNLDELKDKIEEFPNNEIYISLYNYKTDENILRWNNATLDKYEKYAEKNILLFRFRQNTSIIQEEVASMDEIHKFMFIRRSLNLGYDKEIIVEAEKVYNFFKKHFDIKGKLIFNGYNECLLYYPKEELSLKKPSLTYYSLLKLIEEKLELNTLVYESIEPYAQLVPLPGTQNKHTRLYVQFYYPDNTYEEIMKNGQNKFLDEEHLIIEEPSYKLHNFLINMDNEIHSHINDLKFDFEDIWKNIQ